MATIVLFRKVLLDADNIIDIKSVMVDGCVGEFSVNYRTRVDGWFPVFRVDNSHGARHEQRLWIDKTPRRLRPEWVGLDERELLRVVVDHLVDEWRKYRTWCFEHEDADYR